MTRDIAAVPRSDERAAIVDHGDDRGAGPRDICPRQQFHRREAELDGLEGKERDGGTRRELLRVGALSLFGSMTTPRLMRTAGSGGATRPGEARSVILFNLLGGPSPQDMFDLKPLAPAEIRGEFRPIAISVGLRNSSTPPHASSAREKPPGGS